MTKGPTSLELHQDLIARRKDPFDNATPAGGGVAALSLLRLWRLTGDRQYRARAEAFLASLKNAIERVPMGFASTLLALDSYHRPGVEIAVLGDPEGAEFQEALRAIGKRFIPRLTLAGAPGKVSPLKSLVPRRLPWSAKAATPVRLKVVKERPVSNVTSSRLTPLAESPTVMFVQAEVWWSSRALMPHAVAFVIRTSVRSIALFPWRMSMAT